MVSRNATSSHKAKKVAIDSLQQLDQCKQTYRQGLHRTTAASHHLERAAMTAAPNRQELTAALTQKVLARKSRSQDHLTLSCNTLEWLLDERL